MVDKWQLIREETKRKVAFIFFECRA